MTASHRYLKRISVVGGGILALVAGIAISFVLFSTRAVEHDFTSPSATTATTATGSTTTNPFAELDQVVSQLPLANVAFNVPTTLHRNDHVAIQLRLSGEQPIRALKKQLPALGNRAGARIKASEIMEADLTGLKG